MRQLYVESVISAARWLMLGGMVLWRANGWLGGFGGLTGWTAVWLGMCGACFARWREEPGLWMLSGLFLVLSLLVLTTFAGALASGIAQARVLIPQYCDTLGASGFLALQVLFLATVTGTNWRLGKIKKPLMPEL